MKNQKLIQELKKLKQKINVLQENEDMFSREDLSKYSSDELYLRVSNEPTFKYEIEAVEKAIKSLQSRVEQKYKATHQQTESLYDKLAQSALHLK
jgi:flagellar motility protein MotE (MotC chaperone)